jgi:hypothetical protein
MKLRPAVLAAILLAVALAGCSTTRETNPQRTATEQLLISTAADHAAQQLILKIPPGSKVFVDTSNFEGLDSKYAIGTIRERILKQGAHLVDNKGAADLVVEIRSGALSVDQEQLLVGIPHFEIPIPLAGGLGIPEIALFKKAERRGVAKFAATAYNPQGGAGSEATGPEYGFSHDTDWVVLFFISWSTDDLIPKQDREKALSIERPDIDWGNPFDQ